MDGYKLLEGMGVSPGVCTAKALRVAARNIDFKHYEQKSAAEEKEAFWRAHEMVLTQTAKLEQATRQQMGEQEAQIFQAHKMMLEDPELTDPIEEALEDGLSAPAAVMQEISAVVAIFEKMEDEYMRARSADMVDIRDRLLLTLLGQSGSNIEQLKEDVVLIAEDLTPSDTARMDKAHVVGIATEKGGRTSHTAIMANALGIPCVTGLRGLMAAVRDGQILAVDGEAGRIEIEPTAIRLQELGQQKLRQEEEKQLLEKWRNVPTQTADGRRFVLAANVGTPQEAQKAYQMGAEGVGLFRSEFLYMDRRTLPSEQEQFEAYAGALSKDRTVVVRTLDVGGDKKFDCIAMEEEENPFLGERAIRLCFRHEELFLTQLRALLRAAAYGDLCVMFPMICCIEELLQAKECLEKARASLEKEGASYGTPKVGIMIEIPSAALMADALCAECDFISIGTNDLIQYTVAVARESQNIAHLYSASNPAVLKLIKMSIDAAHNAGIPCKMCGEMAGDERMIPLLVGMGLDEFSMSPHSITRVRRQIASLCAAECETLAKRVLTLQTGAQVDCACEAF